MTANIVTVGEFTELIPRDTWLLAMATGSTNPQHGTWSSIKVRICSYGDFT